MTPAENYCPSGTGVLTDGGIYGTYCISGQTAIPAPFACGAGTLSGSTCQHGPVSYSCSSGTLSGSTCTTTTTTYSPVTYTCSSGTLSDFTCTTTSNTAPTYTCSSGTLSGSTCTTTTTTYSPVTYTCSSGTLSDFTCTTTSNTAPTYTCSSGTLSGSTCTTTTTTYSPVTYTCSSGTLSDFTCTTTSNTAPTYTCSSGTLSGSTCTTTTTTYSPVTYTCSSGTLSDFTCTTTSNTAPTYTCSSGTLSGSTCTTTTSNTAPTYTCSSGTLSGSTCTTTTTTTYSPVTYTCSSGTLSGSTCTTTTSPTPDCPSGHTLTDGQCVHDGRDPAVDGLAELGTAIVGETYTDMFTGTPTVSVSGEGCGIATFSPGRHYFFVTSGTTGIVSCVVNSGSATTTVMVTFSVFHAPDAGTRLHFAVNLLSLMEFDDTESARDKLVSWMAGENTRARYNPFATTLRKEGATDFNHAYVKNYPSWNTGLQATKDTLLGGYPEWGYGAIIECLRSDDCPLEREGPGVDFIGSVTGSSWGTTHLPNPVTDDMRNALVSTTAP